MKLSQTIWFNKYAFLFQIYVLIQTYKFMEFTLNTLYSCYYFFTLLICCHLNIVNKSVNREKKIVHTYFQKEIPEFEFCKPILSHVCEYIPSAPAHTHSHMHITSLETLTCFTLDSGWFQLIFSSYFAFVFRFIFNEICTLKIITRKKCVL